MNQPRGICCLQSELKATWQLIRPIAEYLYGYALISIAVIINILTLNVKMKPDESTNSVLLIVPSGAGKTTLLYHILQKSNPDWFPELPEKFFESEILQELDDKFNRKVWVQDDLITTFRGTSTKQREQLMGFFNTFLTKGEYGRKGSRKKGRIICVFGIAKEHYKKHQKAMFQTTFADRFAGIEFDFDQRDKRVMLERRTQADRRLPTVKLPIKKTCVEIEMPRGLYDEVNRLAMLLDARKVMSCVRAQTHIVNFAKATAVLNGRKAVVKEDLKLFKLVFPLYFGARSCSVDVKVREAILASSMDGKPVTGREVKDRVMAETRCSEREVERMLSSLRNENVVNFSKVPGERGYHFEYWL